MKLKGTVSIVRRSGGDGPDYGGMAIILEDAASHARFVEIEIPFLEFGKVVAGLAGQECEFEVRMKAPLGKRYEHQRLLVPAVPWDYDNDRREEAAAAVLRPFEVDGWRGRTEDVFNSHNRHRIDGQEFQEVSFTRSVDPESGEPVARE